MLGIAIRANSRCSTNISFNMILAITKYIRVKIVLKQFYIKNNSE